MVNICLLAIILVIYSSTSKWFNAIRSVGYRDRVINEQSLYVHFSCVVYIYSIPQICVSPEDQSFHENDQATNTAVQNSLARPLQVFKVSDDDGVRVLSLIFYKNTLIVGTNAGLVYGFSWHKHRLTKKAWEVFIASKNGSHQNDVNALHIQTDDDHLIVGCGDNNAYAIDIEGGGKIVRNYKGHTDYIHCIDGLDQHRLYSASEDGLIKFWDSRTVRSVNQLAPYKNERVERKEFGKWQGTICVTDNWLLCGGGPKPCLYHLRSLDCSSVFDFNATVHVAGFLDDTIYIGGDSNHLVQFNLTGEVTAQIPVSSTSIYSVVSQSTPEKFISIAGASNNLDVCTNFSYRDILLKLYDAPKRR